MDGTKVCPKCGSKNFMAIVKRGGIVESTGVDDQGKPTFKLLRENRNTYDLEIIGCATCKAQLTIDDLIGGVICKHCGKMVAPDDIDENGNCGACSLILKNPELENASQADLLRLLAKAYRGISPVNAAIDKKIEMAEQVEAAMVPPMPTTEEGQREEQTATHTAADDILNGNTPPDVQEKKPRRKAVRKKANETGAETSAEEPSQEPVGAAQDGSVEQGEEVPAADVTGAEEALAGAQEAPFPEVSPEFQAPQVQPQEEVVPTQPQVDEAPTGGFQMFDQEEDEF